MEHKLFFHFSFPFQVDRTKLFQSILWVLFNTVFLARVFIKAIYPVMVWRGCTFGRELPSVLKVIMDFIVFIITEEAMFYYSHR